MLGRNLRQRWATAAVAAALPALGLLDASGQAAPRQPAAGPPPGSRSASAAGTATGPIQLQVRRLGNAVELVVEGAGPAPQLQQSARANGWQGQLTTASPSGLRAGPQRLSLPELGFQSISLEGSGTNYSLSVTPIPGVPMPRPVVSADGVNLILTFPSSPQASLQTNRLDLSQPGAVPLPTYAPPLQPRAVAPPLGDMAVGTMTLKNRGYIKLSGPPVTLTVKEADSKEVLMRLARMAGYGFSFQEKSASKQVENKQSSGGLETKEKSTVDAGPAATPYVTASFVGESFEVAYNTILLSVGLQARLEGRTIIVGDNAVNTTFKPSVSKIYRLNQASSSSAADYLASLGAVITKVNVITNAVVQGTSAANEVAGGGATQQTQTEKITKTDTYGGGVGPLKGLLGTTDSRLQTVTLIGDAFLVAVAESYLRQLDLRQRQVALSVKILDVSLNNNTDIANSFAFKSGNTFILNDTGALSATFGSSRITATGAPNPGIAFPNDSFIDTLRAVVTSSSTKVLASPTLILSENADPITGGQEVAVSAGGEGASTASIGRPFANEAFVTVGEQLVTSFNVQTGTNATPVCSPVFSNAGLTFGARVNKIDDNGYVTFSLSPEISAAVGAPQQISTCGAIRTINRRRLDTGNLRVRDGQTLILTGVINDDVQATVSKWPILGDIPLIGQFFRASGNNRRKSELVIMVTPRIVNDTDGGTYGYGYQPSNAEARQFMSAPAPY